MTDDSNSVVDVKELFGRFKSVAELKVYSKKLFLNLQAALKKIKEQESEIAQLKNLLSTSNQFEIIPPEQLTCEMEIRRLQEMAKTRPLSLEEAKIFDIMTKNLLAIKRAAQETKKPAKVIEEDEKTLLSIVANESNK